MSYVYFNDNPNGLRTGDCFVRAVGKVLNKSWEDTYLGLCSEGLAYSDMPSAIYVWGMYLRRHGFVFKTIDSVFPKCTSVSQFAEKHPKGTYVLACQDRIVACIDGDYYDSSDCGDEIVLYYLKKEIEYGLS